MKNWIDRANFKKIWVCFVIIALLATCASSIALYSGFHDKLGELEHKGKQTEQTQELEKQQIGQKQEDGQKQQDVEKQQSKEHQEGQSGEGDGEEFSDFELGETGEIILGVVGGVMGLVGLAYWLLMACWMIQRSRKDGSSGLFFGLLTLFFNLAAVAAYFIYRGFALRCPECGKIQKHDASFCRYCGAAVVRKCEKCGADMKLTDEYCRKCGTKAQITVDKDIDPTE